VDDEIADFALGTIAVLTILGGLISPAVIFIRGRKLRERGTVAPEPS
jgi:hypothetical protein